MEAAGQAQSSLIAVLKAELAALKTEPVPTPPVPPPPVPPSGWPSGGIPVTSYDALVKAVTANPAGSTFRLMSGMWQFGGPLPQKGGNTYLADNPANIPRLVGGRFPFVKATVAGVTLKGLDIARFGPADTSEAGSMVHSYTGGTDWLVEDCNLGDTEIGGIRMGAGWKVRRTRIHDCGRYAMSGGSGTLIEGGEWVHCGYSAADSNRGGCKFAVSNGVTIDGLYVHDIRGNGIWFDIKNTAGTIRNVRVEDVSQTGIFLEVSYGPFTVTNPTIRRCGSDKSGNPADWPAPGGVVCSMTPDITITNPLVEDCRNGIVVIQWNHPQILGMKDGQPFGSLDAARCGNENIVVTGGKVTRSAEYDAGLAGTRPVRAGRPTRNVHWNGVTFDGDAKFRSALHLT